ncbi:hypothetical protein PV327_009854 [Microctonus hyperodae]|uniref:Phospholipid/glycerol acyltransferase domain-containing protein n=1 Tax=Microctonus hyperodae TaxID=165561 RepID=A0AA39KFZ3_MICHY|nr:hypothetical protein PV327_009854 [Microctonus hyperodae]
MAVLVSVVSFVFSLLLTPFLMLLLAIIFLASIGKSLGIRKFYIKLLLTLFEYGRLNIEKVRQQGYNFSEIEDADEVNESPTIDNNKLTNDSNNKNQIQNGNLGNSVIAKSENLIVVPQPESEHRKFHQNDYSEQNDVSSDTKSENKSSLKHQDSFETLHTVFDPVICLDYIRAGVEAIIEDQVTSRFEAEELKNWNLLTRTNRHYEFISWKLTVIWMFGFCLRYCFLLPLRIFICFIGVAYLVIATAIIGFLPAGAVKSWIYDYVYRTAFRIMSRSLSSVITIHNPENKPKSGGLCTANHTSTIDVCILSTQTTFSLVMWLTMCTAVVGYVPEGKFKRWLNYNVSIMCFALLSGALSSVITYHNTEYRPMRGICVANHTSPIDVLVLMCDNCYSLVCLIATEHYEIDELNEKFISIFFHMQIRS